MELQEHKFKVIGTRPIRHDGVDKVTGRAKYGADIYLPGMLHGKVLRSPHAHTHIKSIDTSAALALPGVKAVITGQDLPDLAAGAQPMGEQTINPRYLSMNILARDKVLYHGHAIAAVASTSPHIAEEALALIKVDYELLPPVLDVRKAMQEDSPILHEDLRLVEHQRRRIRQPTSLAIFVLPAAISRLVSPEPMSLSSVSSIPRWCTRVISNRITPWRNTMSTAMLSFGSAPKAPLPSAICADIFYKWTPAILR